MKNPPRQSALVDEAIRLVQTGESPYKAAQMTGLPKGTVYSALKRHGIATKYPRTPRVPMPG